MLCVFVLAAKPPGPLMARFHSEPPDNFLGGDWNFSWSLWYRWDPGKSFFALQETYKTHAVISAWQTPDRHLTDPWQTDPWQTPDRHLTDTWQTPGRQTPDRPLTESWQTPDRQTPDRPLTDRPLTDPWQTPDRPLTDRPLTDPCNYFHSIPLAKRDTGESWGLAIFPGLMQKKGYIFPLLSGTKINWEMLSFALLFFSQKEVTDRALSSD